MAHSQVRALREKPRRFSYIQFLHGYLLSTTCYILNSALLSAFLQRGLYVPSVRLLPTFKYMFS